MKKMADKLGVYITKLMTTVLDKEQEDFVKELAWKELKRLDDNIGEFLHKNDVIDEEAPKDKTEDKKQLILEFGENE